MRLAICTLLSVLLPAAHARSLAAADSPTANNPTAAKGSGDAAPLVTEEAIASFKRIGGTHGRFTVEKLSVDFSATDKPLPVGTKGGNHTVGFKLQRTRSGRLAPLQYFPRVRGAFGLDLRGLRLQDAEFAHYAQARTAVSWLALDSRRLSFRGWSYLQAFRGLEVLSLASSSLTTSEMKYLAGLPHLHTLSLRNTRVSNRGVVSRAAVVSDDGYKFLGTLKSLRTLDLDSTEVTAPAYQGIDRLHELSLAFTKVDDKGLTALGRMPHLKSLVIYNTDVTDAGLKWLTQCPKLEDLNAGSVDQIGSEGIAAIAQLSSLRSLRLHRNDLSKANLAPLANLKKLETLILSDTRLTDAHLRQLHGLKQLKSLDLWGMRLDQDAMKALRAALPNCEIKPGK